MRARVLPSTTLLIPIVLGCAFLAQTNPVSGGTCAAPNLMAAGNLPAGASPVAVVVQDLDADGKLDLVAVNQFSATVSVSLGNGDGTFSPSRDYGMGSALSSVAAGDLNDDGHPDLAVTDAATGNVWVRFGIGDGTFLGPTNYAVGALPQSVAISDLDRDGSLDLVVANRASADISVLLSKGDGTFLTASNYAAGADPISVAVGEFNQDGKPDVVVANAALFDEPSSVAVFLGNGDGTFLDATHYNSGTSPRSVAVGDINGDSRLDLAVANYGALKNGQFTNSTASVLLGNGDGTFRSAVHYVAGEGPQSVGIGNFNADGKPDLAVLNNRSATVSVLANNGDGTLQLPVNSGAGENPTFMAVGTLNGDRLPDLAVARDGGILVLLNTPSDNVPPRINCPSNLNVNAAAGACSRTVTFAVTATDDCSLASLVSVPSSGSAFPVGTTTVTNLAQDSNGNITACTFTVTVVDTQLPVLSGLPNPSLTVRCLAEVPAVAAVTANDHCDGNVSVGFTARESGDPCNRTIRRTWVATDTSGNTSNFTQTITVHDNTKPILTKGTIAASHPTVAEAEAAALAATVASDNCGTVTKTVSTEGDCPIVITVTGTDACGNKESASYNTCILSAAISLAIIRRNTSVTVSWPFPSTGFVLESTPTLDLAANWQPIVEVPTVANGRWGVTVPVTQQPRYFRLRKP